ncbi:type II secretory pathway predicted ATPase ExeA [Mesorhizobium sp. J18]|uniref:ExeA family protein n=1 Tax=Mesorhizobium sp. J18 TaxID=935263 RepID=UPI00119ADBBE|nr:AAA family ATPase [Mesorhizobium sp. J18]TWG96735.1 type II secretory pathway predicted ATPase ExeA [Mesorhizobium sp. J18]
MGVAGGTFLIYAEYFGLKARPFSLLPETESLFWSVNHSQAYAMLEYGLTSLAPITLITGEVGAGKTTLIRYLLRNAPHDLRIGLVSDAHSQQGRLLHWMLTSFGQSVKSRTPYVELFARFETLLRAEHAAGRHTVLIFDEAQNLSAKMLEELRCYTNLNNEKEELLQLVLVGQPELRDIVRRPGMMQFAQRVSSEFHLAGMPADAVPDYIAHRLRVSGGEREIFTADACEAVSDVSRGLPRVINQVCDYALVYAFAQERKHVDRRMIRQVVADRGVTLNSMTEAPAPRATQLEWGLPVWT